MPLDNPLLSPDLDPNGLKAPTKTDAASASYKPSSTLGGATQGINSGLSDRLALDRVKADIAENNATVPQLRAPPKQEAQTDPFQAFGQPAMWIAALGSLFTRQPFVNAIKAGGAVLQATQQLDAAAAKQNFEVWKIETENGLKMAQFQQKQYEDALKRIDVDSKSGKAEIETHIAAYRDLVAQKVAETEGVEGLKKLFFARKSQADATAAGQGNLEQHLQQSIDVAALKSSENRNDVADGIILEAKHRAAIIGAQKGEGVAKADSYSAVVNAERLAQMLKSPDDAVAQQAWAELQSSGYVHGNLKPYKSAVEGSKPADNAAIDTQIRKDNPGMGDGQVVMERNRLVELSKNALSPEAVRYGVDYYKRTGQFPITARSQAAQAAILNEYAKTEHGGASVGDVLENKTTLQADERSLNFITKQKDAAEGYERGARSELQLARDNVPKTSEPLNMQLLTQWVRTGDTKFGGTEVPKFMTFLVSGLDEYAKVLSGSTGAAGSTDSSRAQALSLIPAGATTAQIGTILDAMNQGMSTKIKGYNDQIGSIRGSIRGGAQAPVKLTAGQEDADYDALASGTKFVGPDGHVRTKP